MSVAPLLPIMYEGLVRQALLEDLGRAGDLTTDAIVPAATRAEGAIIVRKPGVLAGLDIALHVFRMLDPAVEVEIRVNDRVRVQEPNTVVATVAGQARALLTGERTALNLLGRLSGIASATYELSEKIQGTRARVACTRKTTPGLRALEKYAVRVGGGSNHRFGLDDAVLIKDNHRALAGGVSAAIERARAHVGHMHKIEIEVDSLDQLREALAAGADLILLDNMPPAMLREAVEITGGRAVLEASGGINPSNIREVAETGVDLISMGWITHSAPGLDVSLDVTCL